MNSNPAVHPAQMPQDPAKNPERTNVHQAEIESGRTTNHMMLRRVVSLPQRDSPRADNSDSNQQTVLSPLAEQQTPCLQFVPFSTPKIILMSENPNQPRML
ncbi:hypothetical protein Ciccas_003426 [Cichlidogyrus casuarinus]|uniref:Uncharacterized protein n=1 Tax=Cichlidogyrus casuarinus TaxID=1844966 RepID=A0ABD2QEF7_9PLAT